VEATSRETADEGRLLVAKAGLYGPGRADAIAMMDRILARNPGTRFASEIRLYRGEDALFKKDYQGALSWLDGIKPEQVPADLRFKLLYLQGQSYKSVRDLDSMRPLFLALVKNYQEEKGKAREWLDVGIGLTLAREFSAARPALELAVSQSNERRLLAEATYWRGMAEAGAGDGEAALDTFLGVADQYSDQGMWMTTALYEAAGICTEKGDYDRALELYRRVLNLSRGDKRTTDKVKAKIAEVKKLKRLQSKSPLPELWFKKP